LGICLTAFAPILTYGQYGNTINGFVFGLERRPIADANIELQDEYNRTVARTRTSASGRYTFERLSSGRFRVRTFSVGDYEEQEQDVEIQNVTTTDGFGNARTSGFDNVQRDFYLKLRRDANVAKPETIFAQTIPDQAKQSFLTALKELDNKNQAKGFEDLKHAIELFPEYYDALELLGSEYVKLKYFVPAQILLQKAVQVNDRGYKSWYGLAYALYSLNVNDEAIKAAEKAAILNPSSIESALLAGVTLRKGRRFDDAEIQLKRANVLAKGSVPEAHWHLALLYSNDLKRYDEAAKELELFLKTSPNTKDKDRIKQLIVDLRAKSKDRATK